MIVVIERPPDPSAEEAADSSFTDKFSLLPLRETS